MSHRPERVNELVLPKKKNYALTQLHLEHHYGTRSKQVLQVNGFPQDDLVQALETGRHKCDHFYHRINRAGTFAMHQVKRAEIPAKENHPFTLPMLQASCNVSVQTLRFSLGELAYKRSANSGFMDMTKSDTIDAKERRN